jgi:hypothetical protein
MDNSRSHRGIKSPLAEQLKARIPKADRPKMAQNLGRMAASLCPTNPINGARQMFDKAWPGPGGEAKWNKRKRLLRLPNEAPSDPYAEGAYDAAGAAYKRLAEAFSELRTESPNTEVQRTDKESCIRDLMQGTSLLPTEPILSKIDANSRSLILELLAKICKRVKSETRLSELIQLLEFAPFKVVYDDKEPRKSLPSEGLEQAAQGANALPEYYTGGRKVRFTDWNDPRESISGNWYLPVIDIGNIVYSYKSSIFMFPRDFVALLPRYDDYKSREMYDMEILRAVKKYKSNNGFKFTYRSGTLHIPKSKFTAERGWGWIDADIEDVLSVKIELDYTKKSEFNISFSGLHLAKISLTDYLGRNIHGISNRAMMGCQRIYCGEHESSIPMDTSSIFKLGYMYFWPHWHDEYSDYIPDTLAFFIDGSDLGLIHFDTKYEKHNSKIIFDKNYDFFPSFQTDESVGTPYAPQSIAAALLRNVSLDKEHRIDHHIVDVAATIANAGLRYYDSIIRHHREIIHKL